MSILKIAVIFAASLSFTAALAASPSHAKKAVHPKPPAKQCIIEKDFHALIDHIPNAVWVVMDADRVLFIKGIFARNQTAIDALNAEEVILVSRPEKDANAILMFNHGISCTAIPISDKLMGLLHDATNITHAGQPT